MAENLFRVQFGVTARSGGHCACKRSAYQACARLDDGQGHRYDYRRKRSEHAGSALLLPEGRLPEWATDAGELWRRAAAAERRADAQESRTIDLTLPRAIPAALRLDCARYVFAPLVEAGMAIQLDVHCPRAVDGEEQPHVHGQATLRRLTVEGFSPKKERAWNDLFMKNGGREMRAQFAFRLNQWCADHGVDVTVDHRSHADRGLAQQPEADIPAWMFDRVRQTGETLEPLADLLAVRAARRQGLDVTAAADKAEAMAGAAAVEAKAIETAVPAAAPLWEQYQAERDALRQAARLDRDRAYREAVTVRKSFAQQARTDLAARQTAERDALKAQHREQRSRIYTNSRRGLLRSLALAGIRHQQDEAWQAIQRRHADERRDLTCDLDAQRLTAIVLPPAAPPPAWTAWLTARAAAGDDAARRLVHRRQAKAQQPPDTVALKAEEIRLHAIVRVGRPKVVTDASELARPFLARIDARLADAHRAADAAEQAAQDHRRAMSWWRRLTDGAAVREQARLDAAAADARRRVGEIEATAEADRRAAHRAASRAAEANAAVLRAWEQQPERLEAAQRLAQLSEFRAQVGQMIPPATQQEQPLADVVTTPQPTAAPAPEQSLPSGASAYRPSWAQAPGRRKDRKAR
jgi:hypothetical protein